MSGWIIGITSALLGACTVAAYIMISRFIGTADRWQEIQDPSNTGAIWSMSLMGSLFLFAAGAIYYRMYPENMMYFIFVLTFIALALSASALGVGLIYKN